MTVHELAGCSDDARTLDDRATTGVEGETDDSGETSRWVFDLDGAVGAVD